MPLRDVNIIGPRPAQLARLKAANCYAVAHSRDRHSSDTDSEAKAQWHDAQATAHRSTVYIMLIRHSGRKPKVTANHKTSGEQR